MQAPDFRVDSFLIPPSCMNGSEHRLYSDSNTEVKHLTAVLFAGTEFDNVYIEFSANFYRFK